MQLQNTVEIIAAPEVVWKVTEDVERWPEWSPTVTAISCLDQGPFDVGSRARIKQSGLPAAVWTVSALARGKGFTWGTRVRGIRMVATHEIHPAGDGSRSVLRIEMSGFVARLLAPLLRRSAARALMRENHGLKARCERMGR